MLLCRLTLPALSLSWIAALLAPKCLMCLLPLLCPLLCLLRQMPSMCLLMLVMLLEGVC